MELIFQLDDLRGTEVQALVARHLQGMHALTPPESVHALGLEKLEARGVRVWSAWVGAELAGIGALKTLDASRGELKSMRVADAFLGQGVGRAMLVHLLREARACEMQSVWLETGSGPAFAPAQRLYESVGFQRCGRFGEYRDDPFSVFMMMRL